MKKNSSLLQNLVTFCFVFQFFTPCVTQANSNLFSTNADLSALNLSSGTLSPIFAAATTAYSATVTNATANITATPSAADAGATIQIRINAGTYVAVPSGNASTVLALNTGSNAMDVKVTASDGVTVKIYTITICRSVTPSVSIAVITGTYTICAGTNVGFLAMPTDGGATPTYQWVKNGAPINGANAATYENTAFSHNDVISCILTSNAVCASPLTATSNAISLVVNALPAINAVTNQTICAGSMTTPITFTGTGTTYSWTNDNPAIGLTANGTGNLAAFAATNNTGAPISATISATAVGRSSSLAYIANNEAQSVSVINTTTQSVVATVAVGLYPEGVATSPNGNWVYVTNSLANTVSVINTASNTVIATINVGEFPRSIAVSPNNNWLYVTNSASHTVSVINAATNTVLTTIPVGMNPYGICFNPNGNQVYVANRGSNSVSVINTSTNLVETSISVSAWPDGIAINPTGTRLYVVNEMPRTLTVINTATNTVVTTIAVGWKPIGVCVNGDGSRVYVTNNIDNTVSVINTATNTVLSTIPVGTDPLGASVTADGSRLYIANKGSNNVSVINTATNSVVATIPVGTAPVSMGHFMATISSNCASAPITFTMTVNPTTIPTLSIGITAGNQTICAGTSVTFTATPTNAGVTPTYQWKKNGTAISGATNSTYTSTTLANNDIIQCVVSNNATCNSTATSNSVTMTVTPSVTPTVLVSVTAGSQTTCAGASVTFTATPTHGGATPTYQWQLNNAPIGGATNATYTSASLANNDIIRCILTSNATCATATTATSNALTLTVNALLTPSVVVAITAGSASVCAGTNVTFTATPTNGGASPAYQWQKNGAVISGATNATYTSASLANNDRIHCILTSNATCLAAATATSNHTMMTIYAKPVVNFTYTIVGGVVTFTNASTAGTTHWNFGDANNSTAVLSNPSFTYTANGSYQVSLEVTSANNCATKLTQTVNVTRVGIHDFAEVLKINVLPNPFSEWLTITMEQTDFLWDEPYQIMVTNSIGQTVYQSVLKAKRMQVNTQSWSDGIYNISLYAKGQVIPLKKGIKITR